MSTENSNTEESPAKRFQPRHIPLIIGGGFAAVTAASYISELIRGHDIQDKSPESREMFWNVPSIVVALFCAWRGAQPPDLLRGPRMIPYRMIMVLAAAVVLVMVVHLVNLAGFETGRR